MKKICILFAICFLYFSANARRLPLPDEDNSNSVSLSTEYFIGSNALTNELLKTYLLSGFISNEMKDRVSKKLGNPNRFGAGFNYGLNFRHRADTMFGLANCYWQIGLKDIFHFDGTFNKDVFEIFFRGNKEYAGKTADLGNFNLTQLFYQQLNFSFGHKFTKAENKFEYCFGLNLNKGHQLFVIKVPDALMYTQPEGEYIDLDAQMEIRQNDSTRNEKSAFNGIGGSADLYFKWTSKKNHELEVSLGNFGFIDWNANTSIVKADTAFRFEGIDISELFDFSDTVSNTISFDSSLTQPYLTNRKKENYITPLPSLAKISYTIPLKKIKTKIETGIGYLLFANSLPYVWQNYKYRISRSNTVGLRVKYGGYSGFNVGLNYELKLKSWKVQLRSDAVDGFIFKEATSQGAFVSLTKYF